jgi:hypothetical protein
MLYSYVDFRSSKHDENELPVVLTKQQFQSLLSLVPTTNDSFYERVICSELVNDIRHLNENDECFIEDTNRIVDRFVASRSLTEMVKHREDDDTLYHTVGVIIAGDVIAYVNNNIA